ncbi:hypothetical protein G9C85_08745 [Halorubellus sp. JP-L1]|uniref:DUF7555 family protein n=1 Tax=Halorubellus sp. JP-L1 TaxID=2715753 RepID=UPI00140E2BB7|nr:hypothetical protein [Halorubellus sp. JP-L1]NHN41718.1 hypothetical protein [Halorubellus sp. JP-L1]
MSSTDSTPREAVEVVALKVVDLLTYVVVLVAVVFVPVAAFELSTFGGLVFTKWVLFVVGGVLGVYSSFQLRPAGPERRAAAVDAGPSSATVGGREVSRLQRVAAAMPPARWTGLTPTERFSPYTKQFAAAVAFVVTAWLLEVVFDVGLGL